MTAEAWINCPDCGSRVRDFDGPTHKYIGGIAGCWEIFGEVLAREYEQPAYFVVHHLTVDTYCAQHPGVPLPQSVQSVGSHLISLYHALVLGSGFDEQIAALKHASQIGRAHFYWLEPPTNLGAITVLNVHAAKSAEEHCDIVWRWATSVWEAWSVHHDTIRAWANL